MLTAIAVATLAILPAVHQQNAMEILTTAARMEGERQANVSNYVVIQSTGVMQAPAYYEKENIDGLPLFRLVPITEWEKRRPGGVGDPAAIASGMALGLDMSKGPFAAKLAGAPGGALVGGYMYDMMTDMSTFLRAAAEADSHISDGRAEASEERRGLEMFAQRARLVGTEDVEGRSAFHLLADDLSDIPLEQPSGDGKFTMVDTHMWIDASEYVPVRLLMHLEMEQDGRKVPMTLELLNLDYERVQSLYQPTRKLMRMSGIMEAMATSPKERRKLEKARREAAEARVQLEQMDAQMAQIPASMRGMVQKQVDKAKKQLEMLTSNGVIEAELLFKIYSVNEGPPFDWIPNPGSDFE